jgi:hypothetical protein
MIHAGQVFGFWLVSCSGDHSGSASNNSETPVQMILNKVPFVFLLLLACARQGFPPGGPVDETPPVVVETQPAQGETGVLLSRDIEIEFSETVEQNSCFSSLFITPYAEKVKYKLDGRRLRILFDQGLRQDRTYVITVGAGTKDLRNNTMAESYTLAFSTGARVDSGKIEGRIYSQSPSSAVQIWAYDLEESRAINPRQMFPLYVTQSGKDGRYLLSHLSHGRYRLFAVLDRDLNGLYNPEFDMLGVSTSDVELDERHPVIDNVSFRVARRDTTPPILISGQAVDRHHIDLRFSEAMRVYEMKNINNFSVRQNRKNEPAFAYLDERNGSYAHLTLKQPMHPTKPCSVQVFRVFDQSGLKLDSLQNSITVNATDVPDTTAPYLLSMSPADSSVSAPLDSALRFIFSESMDTLSVQTVFSMTDSFGTAVNGDFYWENAAHLTFQPENSLRGRMTYFVTLKPDSVFDFGGNPMADSSFRKQFVTLNPDTLTEIAGKIFDEKKDAQGVFYITAKSLQGNRYQLVQKTPVYRFQSILPGRYLIELYRDRDGNEKFSYGNDWPYQSAERFYVYPDTITVRARWPNEDNNIYFPYP